MPKAVVCKREKPNYTSIIVLSLVGSFIASVAVLVIDRATSANLRTEVASLKSQVASLKGTGARYR